MNATETFAPSHLKLWTHPSHYMGAVWPEFYRSDVGQSRDSDALERANFDAMLAALRAVPEPADWPHDHAPFQRVRENHWAVGWVEWIAIHQDAIAHLRVADEITGRLEDYPVIDENRWSEYEMADANETWKNCYSVKERLRYIREHRQQFEFHDFADLLSCVRGKYFAGYPSELLS